MRSQDNTTRTVQVETIISALRRLRKEQYTLYICLNNATTIKNGLSPAQLAKIKNVILDETEDNDKIQLINNQFGENFSNILNFTLKSGKSIYAEDQEIIGIVYSKLKNANFKECIGVYQNATAEGVSDANKETYKIITFVQQ